MILAVFLDGVGIGSRDPEVNPLAEAAYPALSELLSKAVPLDACLDTPGLPQSSTGQVALFTGVNAARLAGGHRSGFPGPKLRRLLAAGTFYHRIVQNGGRATFLNAFGREYLRRMAAGRAPISATTLAAVAAGLPLRTAQSIRSRRRAVYHDISGEGLIRQGETVCLIAPEAAAEAAMAVSVEHDLTLFEYFLTDLAGHRGEHELTRMVLSRLDRFMARLIWCFDRLQTGTCYDCLVVFSDHGNLEDQTTQSHTFNPVPLAIWPPNNRGPAALAARCRSITDLADFLVAVAGKAVRYRCQ